MPADERAARCADRMLRVLLPIAVLALGVVAVGLRGARLRHPALCAAGSAAVFATLVSDWAVLSASLAGHADDDAPGLSARGGRRRRPRGAVQPVAPDRIFALSLCGDPAGDADRGDCAAPAHLSAAAGGGARLRLDRRLLSGARQHHARPQLGRSQPRRPVPALWRVAAGRCCGSSSCRRRCPTSSAA